VTAPIYMYVCTAPLLRLRTPRDVGITADHSARFHHTAAVFTLLGQVLLAAELAVTAQSNAKQCKAMQGRRPHVPVAASQVSTVV
jgi:hypothetical protein